ncbi:MAG: hypothetical protein ABIO96_05555 [Nitrospiraceae bacterium]
MIIKKRVFISFDLDHDEGKKTLLAEQAKLPDSPFEVTDTLVREHLIDAGRRRSGTESTTPTWQLSCVANTHF